MGIIKNLATVLLGRTGGQLIVIFILILISRNYGTESAGAYNWLASFISFMAMLITFGGHTTIIGILAENDAKKTNNQTFIGNSVLSMMLASSILGVLFIGINGIFGGERLKINQSHWVYYALLLSIILFSASVSILYAEILRFRLKHLLSAFSSGVFVGGVIFLLIWCAVLLSINVGIEQIIFVHAVAFSFLLIVLHKEIKNDLKHVSVKNWKIFSYYKSSLDAGLVNFGVALIMNSHLLIGGYILSATNFGFYSNCYRLCMVIMIVPGVVQTAFAGDLAKKYYSCNIIECEKILQKIASISMAICISIALLLIIYLKYVYNFLFGQSLQNEEGFIAMMLVILFNASRGFPGAFMLIVGRAAKIKYSTIAFGILNMVTSFVASTFFGVHGLILAMAVCVVLQAFVEWFILYKEQKINSAPVFWRCFK